MNMKAVTYLYDKSNPDGLAVFQDITKQIRGFSFKQSQFNNIRKQKHADNAGIYFLFGEDEDIKKVYIGQSINGVSRIEKHIREKLWWQRCLLFITDNASFSKTTIDYLEYHFIRFFDKSDYVLINKDLRTNKPNINDFEEPALLEIASQIEFLLACQGIYKQEYKIQNKVRKYKARADYPANLYIKDGKFIVTQGSKIKVPDKTLIGWAQDPDCYNKRLTILSELLQSKKIKISGENEYELLVDLPFNSPSGAAKLVKGLSAINGWYFWQGLQEERDDIEAR